MTDEGLLVILKRRRIKTDAMLEEWSCFFYLEMFANYNNAYTVWGLRSVSQTWR